MHSGMPTSPVPAFKATHPTRGVVLRTYYYDAEPAEIVPGAVSPPASVYCDVLTYGSLPGHKIGLAPRCAVSQERSSIHDGSVWVPKPSRGVLGAPGSPVPEGTSPTDLDGDHVLVNFIDGYPSLGVIVRAMPHPSADVGRGSSDALGRRLKVVAADGDPMIWKHHGVAFGVKDDGNFLVDLTNANFGPSGSGVAIEGGGYQPAATATPASPPGAEVTSTKKAADGQAATGNFVMLLPEGAGITFSWPSGLQFTMLDKDGQIVVGAGDQFVGLGDALQTYVDALKTYVDGHTHLITGVTAGAASVTSAVPTAASPSPGTVKSATLKVKA